MKRRMISAVLTACALALTGPAATPATAVPVAQAPTAQAPIAQAIPAHTLGTRIPAAHALTARVPGARTVGAQRPGAWVIGGRRVSVDSSVLGTDIGLVLDSLAVPATAESGQEISVSARLRATGRAVVVDAVMVAVRDSDGSHFDFPGARPATIGAGGYSFTTGARTFPAGDYEVLAAVRIGNRWSALAPRRYLTVRTNPVTFRQEFSGPADAGPNYGLSTAMWFDDPCQGADCVVRYSIDRARLDGLGHLALTADARSSARLSMLDRAGNDGAAAWSQQGGYFSIRAKLPEGQGLRPSFRTVGADSASVPWPESGGVDVVEVAGQRPMLVRQFAHGGSPDLAYGRAHALPGDATSTGWHVYALDWKPGADGYLRWSVDGVVTQEMTAADAGAAWAAFRRPHTLALELAVDAPLSAAATALVDWIRVYRYPLR